MAAAKRAIKSTAKKKAKKPSKHASKNHERSCLDQLQAEEREARRRLILETSLELFANKHFTKVSMREIAAAAGMSAALIYRHFPSQEALFVEVMRNQYGAFCNKLNTKAKRANYDLFDFAKDYIQMNMQHRSFFNAMSHFGGSNQLSGEHVGSYEKTERELVDIIEALFIKHDLKTHSRMLSHALMSSLNGILISFANYPNRSESERKKHMNRVAKLIVEKLIIE